MVHGNLTGLSSVVYLGQYITTLQIPTSMHGMVIHKHCCEHCLSEYVGSTFHTLASRVLNIGDLV